MKRLTAIHAVLLHLLVALALIVAGGGPAGASAQVGDAPPGRQNAAVAINTKDGSSVFRLAFSIRRAVDGTVDHENVAFAYASCADCQTVAVAFQIVLVMGDADVVSPDNVAVAINDQCQTCSTLASAYQFVVGTGEPVTFSAEGRRRLAQVKRELQKLRQSDLSIEEIQAELDAIAEEVRDILATELVPLPPGSDDGLGPAGPSSTTSTAPDSETTTTSTSVEESVPASSSTTAP